MRTGVVIGAVAAACAVWVAPSAGTPAACDPGQKVVNGKSLYVYCGPATATVNVGGRTYRIFGGRCKKMPDAALYVVDVGILTISGGRPSARYLGIRSKRLKDGATRTAGVAVQVGRRSYTVAPNVVRISGGLSRGTFSGGTLGPAGNVSGTWTCKR